MTVKEAYEALEILMSSGWGKAELISVDTKSGDSGIASFGFLNIVDGTEEAGYLLEMKAGTVYLPVYSD